MRGQVFWGFQWHFVRYLHQQRYCICCSLLSSAKGQIPLCALTECLHYINTTLYFFNELELCSVSLCLSFFWASQVHPLQTLLDIGGFHGAVAHWLHRPFDFRISRQFLSGRDSKSARKVSKMKGTMIRVIFVEVHLFKVFQALHWEWKEIDSEVEGWHWIGAIFTLGTITYMDSLEGIMSSQKSSVSWVYKPGIVFTTRVRGSCPCHMATAREAGRMRMDSVQQMCCDSVQNCDNVSHVMCVMSLCEMYLEKVSPLHIANTCTRLRSAMVGRANVAQAGVQRAWQQLREAWVLVMWTWRKRISYQWYMWYTI